MAIIRETKNAKGEACKIGRKYTYDYKVKSKICANKLRSCLTDYIGIIWLSIHHVASLQNLTSYESRDVSYCRQLECLFNSLFMLTAWNTSSGGFPSQWAIYAESDPMLLRHYIIGKYASWRVDCLEVQKRKCHIQYYGKVPWRFRSISVTTVASHKVLSRL